jgi:cobalamin biosynthesis Mg chelatase CobN
MKKLLIILILCTLYSCGARKVEKKSDEIKTDTNSTVNSESTVLSQEKETENTTITSQITNKVEDKDEIVVTETTYEPKDVTKPAILTDSNGKKTILDNIKKTTKETVRRNNTKSESSSNGKQVNSGEKASSTNSQTNTSEANSDKSSKNSSSKDSDRKAFNPLSLLWLILVLFLIYLGYRWYKNTRNKLPI